MRLTSVVFCILLRQIAAQSDGAPQTTPNATFVVSNETLPTASQSNNTLDGTFLLSNETIPSVTQSNLTVDEMVPSPPTPSSVLPEPTSLTTVSVRENIEMIEIRFEGVKPLEDDDIFAWEAITEEWMLNFYTDLMLETDQPLFNFRTFVVLESQSTRDVNSVPHTTIVYSQFVAYEAYSWSSTADFYARYPFTQFDANIKYGEQLRTSLKKWKDLVLPVEVPLMPGETRSPTVAPSVQPTAQPSQYPTASPSQVPSVVPTDSPVAMPSGTPSQSSSFSPTTTAVEEPTRPAEGSIVNETLLGLQLTLRNAGALVEIDEWESATADWFSRFFSGGPGGRRRLQIETVENVATQISFRSNEVTSDDTNTSINTITYDQFLTYEARDGALSSEAYAILPFEDDAGNTEYGNILRTFSNLEEVELPLASPVVPDQGGGGNGAATDGTDSFDDGMSAGGIVGILLASLIVALTIAGFVGFSRRKRQREKGHEEDEFSSSNSDLAEEEFGDVEQVLSEQPVVSKVASLEIVQSYGLQSVATDDYDYDKAYVIRDRPRSTNSTASASSLVYDFNKLEEEESIVSSSDPAFAKIGAEAVMAYENRHRIRSASSSVSSRGGGSSVKANQTIRLFGSVARDEQVLDIVAPSGKLGLIIDTPNEGPPVVYAIKDSSVLGNSVSVDDRLIAIDDIDVRNMSAIEVSKLISSRNAHPERKLTLLRKRTLHS